MTEEKIKKLVNYIHEEFPDPMSSHFTYDLVENVIRYAFDKYSRSMYDDNALYLIAEMIPEVEVDELAAVLDDE